VSLPTNATTETIDLSGKFIAPGFIDIHIHGGAGSDFMDATRADFETVCRYHAGGGTTSLLATTATAPLPEILAALRTVREVQRNPVSGAQVLGAHIEGPYLSMAKRGCHLKEFVRNPEKAECAQLLEFEKEIKHITLAPEIPGALELMRNWSQRGINISGGHTDSTYSEMMKAVDAGMAHATHMYCAMSTVARPHPPRREGGCVETVLERDELTTELIADGRHLPAELLRLTVRAKGIDRVCVVTDAMRGGNAGRHLHLWPKTWAENRGQEWRGSHAGSQQPRQRGDHGRDGAECLEFDAAVTPRGSGNGND
jgi:N-acetylglucosamine-6-phosphate deacetylase